MTCRCAHCGLPAVAFSTEELATMRDSIEWLPPICFYSAESRTDNPFDFRNIFRDTNLLGTASRPVRGVDDLKLAVALAEGWPAGSC